MSKEKVHAERLIALLNQVLSEQPDFTPGMAFVASPTKNPETIWGTDITTPYGAPYIAAERIVREMYDFDPAGK